MNEVIIEKMSRELREKIRHAKPEIKVSGTIYYVSNDGDDNNDGLTPETAWKTIDRVNANFKLYTNNDAVLFRCGDTFRGTIDTFGLTYASYGEGEKPKLYASPFNAATVSWKDEGDNVYSIPFGDERGMKYDVGNLVFNHGEMGCGYKKFKPDDLALDFDLDFYHDHEKHMLYLKSEHGNPAKRWDSIELSVTSAVFTSNNTACYGAVIDGVVIKYSGGCAIDLHCGEWIRNITVRNCEFEWIGGSLLPSPGVLCRLGNGFQIWGGCENILIENCYFNQNYDAAASPQWFGDTDTVGVKDFIIRGCLFERNTYDIEYFLTQRVKEAPNKHVENTPVMFVNTIFENNICRKNGYGFGSQRGRRVSAACIKGWKHQNKAERFIIRNNIFDRADYLLVEACADKDEWLPELSGNVYCQYLNKGIIDYNNYITMTEPFVETGKNFPPEKDAVIIVAHRPIDELNRY